MERSVTKLPKIREIRDALDIGEKRSTRVQIFNDTLKLFRRNYIGPSGRRGLDLRDWRSKADRAELLCLVDAFLEQNGSRFWPDSRPEIRYSSHAAL